MSIINQNFTITKKSRGYNMVLATVKFEDAELALLFLNQDGEPQRYELIDGSVVEILYGYDRSTTQDRYINTREYIVNSINKILMLQTDKQ